MSKHPYRPFIPTVPANISRPLWSVMIPHYNCAEYLRETLTSVLAQDPGSEIMQIVVVDNCSTKDDPEAIVREVGKGRVEFYRQPENVGMLNNFQTCFELSRGKLIHLLHSDDCVCDRFYEKLGHAFEQHPEIGAAFCRSIYIDEHGNQQGFSDFELPASAILPKTWIKRISDVCCISVPSLGVVRRQVYEHLGGYDSRCGLSCDWEMWTRIFAHYPVWFEAEPLAMWRRHSSSNNTTNAKSKTFIQENFKTIEIIFESYVPDGKNSPGFKQGKQNVAYLALQAAEFALSKGEIGKAIDFLQTAIEYSSSPRVIGSATRIMLLNGVRKSLITSLKRKQMRKAA
jgi:glycosyltransferase involved in cell wall biosynthesis